MVTRKHLEDLNLGHYLNLSVIIHNYLGLLLVISMNWWACLRRKEGLLDLQVKWHGLRKLLMYVDSRISVLLVLSLLGYIRNLMAPKLERGWIGLWLIVIG